MKTIFSIAFIIAIVSGLSGIFMPSSSVIMDNENRHRTRLPEFDVRRSLKKFFEQMDQFAKDNFPLREHFIAGHRWIVNSMGDQINPDSAFRGRDGWFFLGNAHNRNVEKLQGNITPDPENSSTINKITTIHHWFQQQGVDTVFILGPAKSSIYPEKLPAGIKPSSRKHVTPFMEKLRNDGIRVIDPTPALLAHKQQALLYWKNDTHWNQVGSWIAFEQTMSALGVHDFPIPQFEPAGARRTGDLTRLGLFEETSPNNDNDNDDFHILWENDALLQRTKDDIFDVINNPDAARGDSILIIGDSFSRAMINYFSRCFSKTTSIHIRDIKEGVLQNIHADTGIEFSHVVIVVTERAF